MRIIDVINSFFPWFKIMDIALVKFEDRRERSVVHYNDLVFFLLRRERERERESRDIILCLQFYFLTLFSPPFLEPNCQMLIDPTTHLLIITIKISFLCFALHSICLFQDPPLLFFLSTSTTTRTTSSHFNGDSCANLSLCGPTLFPKPTCHSCLQRHLSSSSHILAEAIYSTSFLLFSISNSFVSFSFCFFLVYVTIFAADLWF